MQTAMGRPTWIVGDHAGLAFALCCAAALLTTACKERPALPTAQPAAVAAAPAAAAAPISPPLAATVTAPLGPKLPASLNTGDLDDEEVAMLAQILNDQFDPCGRSRSFMQSLEAGDCALATRLARFLIKGLQDGHGKRRLVGMLLREIERLNTVVELDVTDVPSLGEVTAKVKVVEFSDFECPFCRRAAAPVKRLQAHYGFALYFKHFPLTNHKLAEGAARATWAAQQQGHFWPLHDLLWANADKLQWQDVKGYAAAIGLDMKRFASDVNSDEARKAVQRDYDHGVDAGVDGTPTFFVAGRRAETLAQLQDSIREQLSLSGVTKLPEPLDLSAAESSDSPPKP